MCSITPARADGAVQARRVFLAQGGHQTPGPLLVQVILFHVEHPVALLAYVEPVIGGVLKGAQAVLDALGAERLLPDICLEAVVHRL